MEKRERDKEMSVQIELQAIKISRAKDVTWNGKVYENENINQLLNPLNFESYQSDVEMNTLLDQ